MLADVEAAEFAEAEVAEVDEIEAAVEYLVKKVVASVVVLETSKGDAKDEVEEEGPLKVALQQILRTVKSVVDSAVNAVAEVVVALPSNGTDCTAIGAAADNEVHQDNEHWEVLVVPLDTDAAEAEVEAADKPGAEVV